MVTYHWSWCKDGRCSTCRKERPVRVWKRRGVCRSCKFPAPYVNAVVGIVQRNRVCRKKVSDNGWAVFSLDTDPKANNPTLCKDMLHVARSDMQEHVDAVWGKPFVHGIFYSTNNGKYTPQFCLCRQLGCERTRDHSLVSECRFLH